MQRGIQPGRPQLVNGRTLGRNLPQRASVFIHSRHIRELSERRLQASILLSIVYGVVAAVDLFPHW